MGFSKQRDATVEWDKSRDVVSAFVDAAGLRGLVLASLELGAPWRVRNPAARPPVLHYVRAGVAFFRAGDRPDSPWLRLETGDAVMLPSGGVYELADDPDSQAPELVEQASPGGQGCSVRNGASGATTKLSCYRYRFRDASAVALLRLLPEQVVVQGSEDAGSLGVVLRELDTETSLHEIGSDGVVARLAEVAYLRVLRHHFEHSDERATGLLAAVADPHVGAALREVHAALAEPWTVAKLAGLAGLSRAAFSRVFTERTGESPMHYVQRSRMQAAAGLMSDTTLTFAEIGRRVGYEDAAAFSRAFRRELGVSPREYRGRLTSRASPDVPEPT